MATFLENMIKALSGIQEKFYNNFGVSDIYSNSKIYEIIIADALNHDLIPGHSGSRNGTNGKGGQYEYKHYKETSSNHTWTFNDFSKSTIDKLNSAKAVVFAHINDLKYEPYMDWCYIADGKQISDYLSEKTKTIKNKRKMINISPSQLEQDMRLQNATNGNGNFYEYKISKTYSWNFQDISENVLTKYLRDKAFILAVVDKNTFKILALYEAKPELVVGKLREKLKEKEKRFSEQDKELRRLQVSLSKGDIEEINALELDLG